MEENENIEIIDIEYDKFNYNSFIKEYWMKFSEQDRDIIRLMNQYKDEIFDIKYKEAGSKGKKKPYKISSLEGTFKQFFPNLNAEIVSSNTLGNYILVNDLNQELPTIKFYIEYFDSYYITRVFCLLLNRGYYDRSLIHNFKLKVVEEDECTWE